MDAPFPFAWDYDLTSSQFLSLLRGEATFGRLDRDWAAVRLLEYASFPDIVRHLGFKPLVSGWPRWRGKIRAPNRRRGLDFLADWLPRAHPELL